jgi:hypothetical protein
MSANLLARLNEEYPASRFSTAWVLDEVGVPTRRAGKLTTRRLQHQPSAERGTIGADVWPNWKSGRNEPAGLARATARSSAFRALLRSPPASCR